MPVLVSRSDIDGILSTVEATVEGNGEKETVPIELIVSKESELLTIAVAGPGPRGYLSGPRDVRVSLVDPDGRTRDDLLVRGPEGQSIFFVSQPASGRWTLLVDCGPQSAAGIDSSIVPRGAAKKMARLGQYLRCKTCKLALKALVIALLAHLAPLIAAGLGVGAALGHIGALAAALLDAIAKTLGVAKKVLEGILDTVKEYGDDPVDRVLERCCRVAKLCAA